MNNITIGVLLAMTIINNVSATEQILPAPDREGGMPLMQALNERHSVKQFADKEVDNKTLSEILWAAYGINRSGGLRTIPTAMNQKDLEIYVARGDGIWQYNALKHTLRQIRTDNILPLFQTQDYMKNVPLVLIYTGKKEDNYPFLHAGSAYQNVGLYAASRGIGAVVRSYFDKDAVAKALNLPNSETVITSQAIGWED